MTEATKKDAHVFEREEHDWYVEPTWAVELLLGAIEFTGAILDPACGGGTIPKACIAAGHERVTGMDIVDRGYGMAKQDFLAFNRKYVAKVANIITNPPYKLTEEFVRQALKFTTDKVAIIVPLKFLASNTRNALFNDCPVWRICVLSSRPSMLPGRLIEAGQKPGGGAIDYCWIVFKRGYTGNPETIWLMRDGAKGRPYGKDRVRKAAPEAALRGGGK